MYKLEIYIAVHKAVWVLGVGGGAGCGLNCNTVVFVLPQTKKLGPNNFSGYKSMGIVKSEMGISRVCYCSGLCT